MDQRRAILHKRRREEFINLKSILRQGNRCKSQTTEKLMATRQMSELRGRFFLQAFNKDKIVAWAHVFVPSEILHAMEIIPFNLEAFSSMLSKRHLSAKALQIAEANVFSSDSCSFLGTALGAAIDNFLPSPDILISTTKFCDSAPKIYYQMSKYYDGSINYTLDIPYHESEEAIEYVVEQLEEMVNDIENTLGIKMDNNKLVKAIEYSNQARKYFLEINDIRRSTPAPILGSEALDYAAMLVDTWGTREAASIYKLLYNELKDRVKNNYSAVEGERYRLLWLHLRPYYTEDILSFIEKECKAVIAFEEVNHIFWDEMDPEAPYRSLAKKLVKNCITSEFCYKHKMYTEAIDKYNIDGVILFYHKGCSSVCSSIQITKEFLKTKGVPVLSLEGECIDNRQYSEGQTKTRIQAFIELLETSH